MQVRMNKIKIQEEDPDQYYKPYPDHNKKKECRMRTESGSHVS